MNHNPLADLFNVVKNAESVGKKACTVPASKLHKDILKTMQENKYIGSFEFIDDGKGGKFNVELIGRINNCSVITPRFSVKKSEFIKWEKRYLPADNVGIIIVTTNDGVIDQHKARKLATGGKLLGYVY